MGVASELWLAQRHPTLVGLTFSLLRLISWAGAVAQGADGTRPKNTARTKKVRTLQGVAVIFPRLPAKLMFEAAA